MIKNVIKLSWALLLACFVGLGMASCADPEEGESWGDWEFRNDINCAKFSEWSIEQVKIDGEWVDAAREDVPFFAVQFFAKTHDFNSRKWSWAWQEIGGDWGWVRDDATLEEYKQADNTAFTVDSKTLTIEGTVDGEKYFRIVLDKKIESPFMQGKLYFYKEDKTYEVLLRR